MGVSRYSNPSIRKAHWGDCAADLPSKRLFAGFFPSKISEGLSGEEADWWVMGYFSGVYLYLRGNGTWTTTPSTWAGWNLMDIYSSIFSGTLRVGTYTIYFEVDLTPDGVMNDPMYYDYINIVVQ